MPSRPGWSRRPRRRCWRRSPAAGTTSTATTRQTGGFYQKGGPVTKDNFLKYKAHRREFGAQGVGPTQLTLPAFQDQADARGGAWDWRVNALVGFEILAGHIKANGIRDGFRRYNGSGEAAESYADDAMKKLGVWRGRLGGAAAPAAASASDAAPGGTPLLRQGSKGAPVGQLQRCLNKVQRACLTVDADFGTQNRHCGQDVPAHRWWPRDRRRIRPENRGKA